MLLTPKILFETVTSTIKNSIDQERKVAKAILRVQSFYLKKKINNKEKLYSKEKNVENKNNPKEL